MKVKTDYVPEDSRSYLTPGKVYELNSAEETVRGVFGEITDDEGEIVFICVHQSSHLGGEAWEVVSDD